MDEKKMDETTTAAHRTRRSSDAVRADKIKALESKISKKEREIAELRSQIEALKKPRPLSERERQALLKDKVASGALSEEEAYQLGWKV